jgi:hypothetical protein
MYARKAMSDFKNVYLDVCNACGALDSCDGMFKSVELIHSAHIRPLAPYGDVPARVELEN